MAQEIGQRRAGRLRVPRVQIAYDLHLGGEDRRKELPFVLGVLADVAGSPDPPPPKLRERSFTEISTSTLDTVIKNLRPRLAFSVPNRLAEGGSTLGVALRFERLADFEPESVARQVEPLRKLVALRRRLVALRARARRDPSVEVRLRAAGGRPRSAGNGGPSDEERE